MAFYGLKKDPCSIIVGNNRWLKFSDSRNCVNARDTVAIAADHLTTALKQFQTEDHPHPSDFQISASLLFLSLNPKFLCFTSFPRYNICSLLN